MQNEELLGEFVVEAETHVHAVEDGLLDLERGEGDSETINVLFRSLHSIKGTAGFFSLTGIVDLSHAMENLFSEIRKGNFTINDKAVDILLEANDYLKQMIENVEQSNEMEIGEHLERINGLFAGDPGGEVPLPEQVLEKQPASGETLTQAREQPPPHDVQGDMKEFFANTLRQGQKIYLLQLAVDDTTGPADSAPPAYLITEISSIGMVVETWRDNGNWLFLFTSVLETSLVAMALNMGEEAFNELSDPSMLPPRPGDRDTIQETAECETDKQPPVPAVEPLHTGKESPAAGTELPPAKSENDTKKQAVENKTTGGTEENIRVSVSLLNDLLNLASEMVLGRNQLLRLLASFRKETPGLNTVLQNIDQLTSELQEKIMLTRMQSMARVFNKFPRIVRELSRKTGKNVELSIKGQDVELDKSIVEGLGDPLTHLVRNSIDHGIEAQPDRETSGKSSTGTISLHAYHEGGQVVIDIKDDGAGINVEKIKKKALEYNLFSSAELASMGQQELFGLLLKAGFSTATEVTDLSGRGVGLDVVKTNIERLGGVMEIMSELGTGTTFRLTMPLTLAIIPSLILEVSGQKFALPQVNLQEMVRVKASDPTKRIEELGDAHVIRLREKLLPIVHLADVLGLEKDAPPSLSAQADNQLLRVLIIKSGSKRFGLIVDLIHDGEEILVKQLPGYLKDCLCYSGVTILGDGMISMILDPEGIANKAGLRFYNEGADQLLQLQDNTMQRREQQSLLLFMCSGPETFCVDLSMVARVEKVRHSQLETVGEKEFVQFRGESLRVIRPEDYLPVKKQDSGADDYYVIIPKLVVYPMGILIHKIFTNYDANIQFNQDEIKAKGLMGTTILSNRLTLVINIFELFEMAAPEHYSQAQNEAKNRTVLIAEDTPFFLKLEKQYLEWAGYQVLTAVDGKEAWEILQEEHVDLVVSDIEMPIMDGFELIKKIRGDRSLAGLPVIAVTSRSDEPSMQKGLELGFNFYEIKLNKDMLLQKVKLALEQQNTQVVG